MNFTNETRADVGVDLTKSTSADLSMFKSKPAGFKFLNRRSHFFSKPSVFFAKST